LTTSDLTADDPAGLQIRPLRPGDDPEAQLDAALDAAFAATAYMLDAF
jgi:hypothetical protein